MSQYAFDIARNCVKAWADQNGIGQKGPQVYQAMLNGLFSQQNSQAIGSLQQWLDQKTGGQWRNQPIAPEQMMGLVAPWADGYMRAVAQSLSSQQRPGYGQPQSGYGQPGYQQPGYGSHNLNPTANMYDNTRVPQQDSRAFVAEAPVVDVMGSMIPSAHLSTDYNLGSPVSVELHKASNVDLTQPTNGVMTVRNLFSGDHDRTRLLTSEITLKIAQNTALGAGKLIHRYAPQEVIRGSFANVVLYEELFHIPTGYKEFVAIAEPVWEAFSKNNDWRGALKVLNDRTRGEWMIMSQALCRLINDMIYRRLRADAPGVMILGIDALDDLSALDDRYAEFAVAKHANYWQAFNKIVETCIENLLTPENLVTPDDKNFGDFVNCDEIMFCADGRSKTDYGTFTENVDRAAFIDRMMATDTVVRIPRSAILTNALDPRLVAQVKRFKPTEQLLLSGINTVGTSLIGSLDYLRRGDVQDVVCLDLENKTETVIKIGTTLDGTLTLLNPNH